MNKKIKLLLKFLVLVALLVATKSVATLPWWAFLVPALLFGLLAGGDDRLKSFLLGFVAGFTVWLGANLWFDSAADGVAVNMISQITEFSKWTLFTVSGVLGGILAGLAMLVGSSVLENKVITD